MNRARLLFAAMLAVGYLNALAGEETEFELTSTYDGTTQQAAAFIPAAHERGKPLPLLVIAHYFGGTHKTAKALGYYPEADARGWLVVCPGLHGHRLEGQKSWAALEAQHDVIDAIAHMEEHYQVDPRRIYIAGRSMGGMLAMLMAAKYPDLFAAAVAGQGISDLKRFVDTTVLTPEAVVAECGAWSDANRFVYERRSAIHYARNLQYVPLILWHGTNDTRVPPDQSSRLATAVQEFSPYHPDVHWLIGAAHCPRNYPARWVCDQLQFYENTAENGFALPHRFYPQLDIVTDEAKGFFWLNVAPARAEAFAAVQASVTNSVLKVRAENVASVGVSLDLLPPNMELERFDVAGDGPLKVLLTSGDEEVCSLQVDDAQAGSFPERLQREATR